MNKQTASLIAVFLSVLIVSGLASYIFVNRSPAPVSQNSATPARDAQSTDAKPAATQPGSTPTAPSGGGSIISRIFGNIEGDPARTEGGDGGLATLHIVLRFALAALLAAMLAFRPRKRHLAVLQRNPYVAQTQILLAVVASALMMVVGDSAARAFGIFAAASLVRFRTNIRDPKEITVLLISLAIGLATGVGRWELALVLSLFVLLTLWVLEHFESSLLYRAMELKVVTRNVEATNALLKGIFKRHQFTAELREIDREDEAEPLGKLIYHVNVGANISTDQISSEITSADQNDIDAIEWQQTKSASYIYG